MPVKDDLTLCELKGFRRLPWLELHWKIFMLNGLGVRTSRFQVSSLSKAPQDVLKRIGIDISIQKRDNTDPLSHQFETISLVFG
jgi:hypothetical protein